MVVLEKDAYKKGGVMRAKEVMSNHPEFLPPTATLKEAADRMKSGDYGFVPIGENDRLIGAITDRDLAIRAVASGKDPNTQVKDVMSKGIQYCFEDDDLTDIAKKMEELQIRRLVVLDKDKRMTGIISLGDIATKCPDLKLRAEIIEGVSEQ